MLETTTLAERLKKQMHEECEIIQNLTQKQLNTMRTELNDILWQELNTIKADIQQQSSSIGWSTFKSRLLWPTIVGLSLSLGLFIGAWAMMRYLTSEVTSLQYSVDKLTKDGGKIQFSHSGKKKRLCAKINLKAGGYGKKGEFRILEGY